MDEDSNDFVRESDQLFATGKRKIFWSLLFSVFAFFVFGPLVVLLFILYIYYRPLTFAKISK